MYTTKDDAKSYKPFTKKRNIACHLDGCGSNAALIIGTCNYCKNNFCLKHRLPESHECREIAMCKQRAFEKNAVNLMEGKCIASKI